MTQSAETQFALIAQWKKVMEDELLETKAEVAALRKERDNALKWGIATLGSAVMTALVELSRTFVRRPRLSH